MLPLLVEISKIDVRTALIQAQQKRMETELKQRTQSVAAIAQKRDTRIKLLGEKKTLSMREEKGIKFERDKINDRRRALNTLNNYKLQQAAEREIDFVSKQVGQREDLLLGLMREVELLEKDVAESEVTIQGMVDELQVFEKATNDELARIGAELKELQSERAVEVQKVDNSQILVLYNRTIARFPSDPIVDLANRDSCSGCFMKVGPQVSVQISRGDVVKCPGCGRLLKLPKEE